MFSILNFVLGFYSHLAIAWIFTVAADIAINKSLLKISPQYPEYHRGMIANINPVGLGSLALPASISVAMFFGAFDEAAKPYSVVVEALIAVVAAQLIAVLTKSKYFRRHHDGIEAPLFDAHSNPSDERFACCVTGEDVERPDVIHSATDHPDGSPRYISSLALTMDKGGEHMLPGDLNPREEAVFTRKGGGPGRDRSGPHGRPW